MDDQVDVLPKISIAYAAGAEAKRSGIPLKQSVLKKLRPGTTQYQEFIDGYFSLKTGG